MMSDAPYVFPDVDALLIGYLKDALPNYNYGVELPADLDQKLPFVLVARLPGGPRSYGVFDDAREDLEVRATTREESHDVMQEVLAQLDTVYKATFPNAILYGATIESSPGYFPDPITRQPRWIATLSVRNRPKR
jgi:hypothetical protein